MTYNDTIRTKASVIVDANDSDPGVSTAGQEMIAGVFIVVDKLLPPEHQRVVTADCRNGFP